MALAWEGDRNKFPVLGRLRAVGAFIAAFLLVIVIGRRALRRSSRL
jgi:hypothetical protein